jgi:hypothetical protein
MSPLNRSSRNTEIRQALKAHAMCTFAVFALVIGAYTLVFLQDLLTGPSPTPVAHVETEHYLANYGP